MQNPFKELASAYQPLQMPPPSPPPALSPPPPYVPNPQSTPPAPLTPPPQPPDVPAPPPTAPADLHESCVPASVFNNFMKDYKVLENRFKATEIENRLLKQQLDYYREICHAQRDGDVPKRTSDLIFKKRLEPFLTETQSRVWVKNLKRPRKWKNEGVYYFLSEYLESRVTPVTQCLKITEKVSFNIASILG